MMITEDLIRRNTLLDNERTDSMVTEGVCFSAEVMNKEYELYSNGFE